MHGQCLCGAIAVEVSPPTKWRAHCHCRLCRRAHGTAFVTWFGVPALRVKLLHDDSAQQWFYSSENGQRVFCRNCGSALFFCSERWPGELHIALAARADPSDRPAHAHVYYDRHVSWLEGLIDCRNWGSRVPKPWLGQKRRILIAERR